MDQPNQKNQPNDQANRDQRQNPARDQASNPSPTGGARQPQQQPQGNPAPGRPSGDKQNVEKDAEGRDHTSRDQTKGEERRAPQQEWTHERDHAPATDPTSKREPGTKHVERDAEQRNKR